MTDPKFGPDYFDEEYYFKGGLLEMKMLEWGERAKWLVKRFSPARPLEIGAGEGCLVESFARLGVESVGVDMSRYGSHLLKDRKGSRVMASDTLLPFQDKTFDFCVGFDIWEHNFEEDVPALAAEVARVTAGSCFFNIALEGQTDSKVDENHLTLKPRDWWLGQFEPHFVVEDMGKDSCPTLVNYDAEFLLRVRP